MTASDPGPSSEETAPAGRRPPVVRRRGASSARRTVSIGWISLVAVGLMIITVAFAAARSYQDLRLAQDRAAELESEIDRARGELVALEELAERLRDDPLTIERTIRAELGMVTDDQIVIVLPDSSTQ